MRLKIKAPPGQDAYVIKTNHIDITDEVLRRIEKRHLTAHPSGFGTTDYVIQLDLTAYGDCKGFHLALDRVGADSAQMSNLVESSMGFVDDDRHSQVVVLIRASTFVLASAIGRHKLLDAARHGFVILKDPDFSAQLEHLPQWPSKLEATPPALVAKLEQRFDGFRLTPSEFWRHVHRIRYGRDNY